MVRIHFYEVMHLYLKSKYSELAVSCVVFFLVSCYI